MIYVITSGPGYEYSFHTVLEGSEDLDMGALWAKFQHECEPLPYHLEDRISDHYLDGLFTEEDEDSFWKGSLLNQVRLSNEFGLTVTEENNRVYASGIEIFCAWLIKNYGMKSVEFQEVHL